MIHVSYHHAPEVIVIVKIYAGCFLKKCNNFSKLNNNKYIKYINKYIIFLYKYIKI